ncbi:sugar transferase [Furfurilactobacillus siliginis]|uniref:UDP-phosphate galactose phosphotransferase n=1 Tax=Furfurilactobacillus siliginis TaxID=348151 RepID=A0A0R2KXI9_9LACO|nr:sugar transferase [Furfurilactobacillus siliginis]KRN94251.1 hypothetical protein IV55_GL000603 [Furfurilactobacillus siliginis]GEK29376.1 UDP-phosphate galactose phosphotransferase [Furfurilactobacillus siliginis]
MLKVHTEKMPANAGSMTAEQSSTTLYQRFGKRSFDTILSLAGLIVASPLFLVTAVCIKLDDPKGPILFKQQRGVTNNKTFNIYKFRTMSQEAPHNMASRNLASADDYITPVGKFLRKKSIDELPQLLNIFLGQMAFIGPRPVTLSEQDLLKLREAYGLGNIKGGVSGLAQISGRDKLLPNEKVKYDSEYAEKITFKNDVKLVIGTVISVLKREDIVEGKLKKNTEK